jgi:hypothetical protein
VLFFFVEACHLPPRQAWGSKRFGPPQNPNGLFSRRHQNSHKIC